VADSQQQKTVYLFGAGATHAELANFEPNPQEDTFERERGLLIRHVSRRVIEIAQSKEEYLADIQMISGSNAPQNIELLISLILFRRIPRSKLRGIRRKRINQINKTNQTCPRRTGHPRSAVLE
jgi:hypothetical protein